MRTKTISNEAIDNFYGAVVLAVDKKENYYLKMDDVTGPVIVPVSSKFAKAFLKEFGYKE